LVLLIGLWYVIKYLDSGKLLYCLLFFVFTTLGGLIKIPALTLISALAFIFLVNYVDLKKKLYISTAVVFVVVIVSLWYFYWVPYLIKTYGFYLYHPRSFAEGFSELSQYWADTLNKFYYASFHSFAAFGFFIIGIIVLIRRKEKILLGMLLMVFLIFSVFMLKAGLIFSTHDYYIIPIVPVMAVIAAFGLTGICRGWIRYACLAVIMLEGILNQHHDFIIKEEQKYKLEFEAIADECSGKDDLVLINGGTNPQAIYFLHRKGWTVSNTDLHDSRLMDDMAKQGAKYLFVDTKDIPSSLDYPLIIRNDFMDVYELYQKENLPKR